MSEKRRRDHSALLHIDGKKTLVEFFAAAQWGGGPGLFRLSVNGKWHGGQRGKYQFFTMPEALETVLGLFQGAQVYKANPAQQTLPELPEGTHVRVHYGPTDAETGIPAHMDTGYTRTPPQIDLDGVPYVWVWVSGPCKTVKVPLADCTVLRRKHPTIQPKGA